MSKKRDTIGKDSSSPSPEPAPSFEDALAQVEGIIERIESGEVGLEDALGQYEHGVRLIAICRGKLERAKQRVEDLTRALESVDEGSAGGDQPQRPSEPQD